TRDERLGDGQVALAGVPALGALLWVVLGSPSTGMGLLGLILLPGIGLLVPSAWLTRKVDERKTAIFKDLPDTLDLLAISVEAGMGFAGGPAIVCQHFHSPLGAAFHRPPPGGEPGLAPHDPVQ